MRCRRGRRAHEKDRNLILSCFSQPLRLLRQILWISALLNPNSYCPVARIKSGPKNARVQPGGAVPAVATRAPKGLTTFARVLDASKRPAKASSHFQYYR